jgi:phenylpyruvate tautomerase PptA (4-oxalocrotonate tautomerase family)
LAREPERPVDVLGPDGGREVVAGAVADTVTSAVVDSIGCSRDSVRIFLEEFDPENWAAGGRLDLDRE